ncbi:hypothetical protein PF008_g4811 [Phytophthora fragariae]|uniref:Uncharacterized protein n=1 Tax=Phytophthora fragariae TaxID=53985 RepID=A0A6G0SA73_9STRA|nr:hypothetical protein PF008_g4811 [Phytophthora fragariae]
MYADICMLLVFHAHHAASIPPHHVCTVVDGQEESDSYQLYSRALVTAVRNKLTGGGRVC